jgi:hypothetical protein
MLRKRLIWKMDCGRRKNILGNKNDVYFDQAISGKTTKK